VQRLLENRDDIFKDYHQSGFEQAFGKHFHHREPEPVGTDGRVLYLMQAR
jgi:hypothetical protein